MYQGEKLNSISHLAGAVLALVGLGALLSVGVQTGDSWIFASFAVFGLSLVLLYTMSTLYHSFRPPELKRLFRVFDHLSIYLLIAGTYTPFMLVCLRDSTGWYILGVVWALAVLGALSELFLSGRAVRIGQLLIYMAMGWTCAYDMDGLRTALPAAGYNWLTTGGIAYTTGVLFYVLDKMGKLVYAHGIWHAFVLAGSICHFIAVIGFVR
ncbi:MAG: hemolysin III [Gemmatimonadetes bacterium]|nr:hemolysin III [Gemmatimonadota bacterium]